ncbi:MAG TPA: FtsX-like permease family protein [Tepidisphaeraceae bacterium]|nr:FtsX-like permease family protein [Tepidisphaeraceae bacterium]
MLCTTMVLVVISVMGGWLNMFKSSFRGLSGDLVVHTDNVRGFPFYQQMIAELEKDKDIQAAVPSIETYGLIDYGNGPKPARVMGISIAQMGTVNHFPESLYRQHTQIEDALKNSRLPVDQKQRLQRELAQPPSFDLLDQVIVPMPTLPAGLSFAKAAEGKDVPAGAIAQPARFPTQLQGRLRYDSRRHNLIFKGKMASDWKPLLASLSNDPEFAKAIDSLYEQSRKPGLITYGGKTSKLEGIIVGVGVVGIRRNQAGNWERPDRDVEFTRRVGLTVFDLTSGGMDTKSALTRNYVIVDDSHLGVWQYDNMYVYVPFKTLQKDLGLDSQPITTDVVDGKTIKTIKTLTPACTTDIHIKVKRSIDANDESQLVEIRGRVQKIIDRVLVQQQQAQGELATSAEFPVVLTWQDTVRVWISAVENEKLLTVMLFGIMCIVAIFLIFCIFYMIVVEKTRDIGIIKSVGATSAGVAGIFLGYGLIIGIIGAGLGLLVSYGIVHNINEMHAWLGRETGYQIWNPEVYQFDKIPNTMNVHDIIWILPIAVLSSVMGALIPAVRAGRLNPVDSLRWE